MEKKKMFHSTLMICVLTLLPVVFTLNQAAAASKPTLNLFPSDVTEQLTNTGTVAKQMEKSLKGTIQKLDAQKKLYDQTGCDGSSEPGCDELAKQMGDHYMEILTIMKENLPEMKQSITATHKGIEKNLRKEVGKKTSPADIQRLLGKNGTPKVFKGKYSLSSRFAQYHKMISRGSNNTLATLAAEIYLDSGAVLNMIGLMEAEIVQQETMIKLGQMYGTLTPQMIDTVDAVKAVIFGEVEDGGALPMADGGEVGGFRSPLEMD